MFPYFRFLNVPGPQCSFQKKQYWEVKIFKANRGHTEKNSKNKSEKN